MAQNAREKLTALMEQMRVTEQEAVNQLSELFLSDDMQTLTNRIGELQQETIPGGHYDQILGSVLNVINSTRNMFTERQAMANATAPTVIENQPIAPNGSGEQTPA